MHFVKPDDFNGRSHRRQVPLTNLSDAAVEALRSVREDAGMGHKRLFDEKYPEAGRYTGFSSTSPSR